MTTSEARSAPTTGAVIEATPAARPEAVARDPVDEALTRAVEGVFISPRVVDQRSFEELTGALQRVVRDAQAQGRALAGAGEQVRAMTEQLRSLMKEAQEKAQASLRVLPAIESKIAKLTGAADGARRVGHEAARPELDAAAREAIVRDAAAAVRRETLDALRAEFASVIESEVAARVGDALRAAAGETGGGQARAAATAERAQSLLLEFERSAERAEARIGAVLSAADRAIERAEAVEKSLEERVLRATVKLDEAAAANDRRTEAVASEITEQLTALRNDARLAVADAQKRLSAAGDEAVSTVRREAGAAVGAAAADAIARVDAKAREAHEAAQRLENLLSAARSACDGAAKPILDADQRIKTALAAVEALERKLTQAAHRGPVPQSDDAARLAAVAQQAHAVGVWLTQLLGAAQHAAMTLQTMSMAANAVTPPTSNNG
ncbi:MAG TPA: hypothetical protein VD971_02290 [Phycisphaerales bacterium]|nr:hypothetical protein [Phycisphaerales bacterium]